MKPVLALIHGVWMAGVATDDDRGVLFDGHPVDPSTKMVKDTPANRDKRGIARRQKTPVPKPRNGGRMTEDGFWQFLRNTLRRASMRSWGPLEDVYLSARRLYDGPNKKLTWEYKCAFCGGWFPRKEVEANHIEPCGSLKCYADLPEFVRKLFCEPEGLMIVCLECHNAETQRQKAAAELQNSEPEVRTGVVSSDSGPLPESTCV